MTKELENLLLEHLGELLYDYDAQNDHFEKVKIETKIKAAHDLLELPHKLQSPFASLLKSVNAHKQFYSQVEQ